MDEVTGFFDSRITASRMLPTAPISIARTVIRERLAHAGQDTVVEEVVGIAPQLILPWENA